MIIDTTLLMAFSSAMVAVSVVTPSPNAVHVASVFMGLFGGLVVQGWTYEKRKPTRPVMISDVAASAFSGFIANVMGVPACMGIINKFLPEEAQLDFIVKDHLAGALVVSGIAGMLGAGLLRKIFDRVNPSWSSNEPRP